MDGSRGVSKTVGRARPPQPQPPDPTYIDIWNWEPLLLLYGANCSHLLSPTLGC